MNIIRLIYILLFSLCFQFNAFGTHGSIKKLEKQFNFEYAIQVVDSALTRAELQFGKQSTTYEELLYEKIVIYEAFNKNKEALTLVEKLKSRTLTPYLSAKLDIELSLIYEKIQYFDDCFLVLDHAKFLIYKHKIDSLKPFYFLRRSSALRVSGSHKQALNLVDSALLYGDRFQNKERLAHIYLVKAFLERTYLFTPKESVESFKQSAYYAKQTQDLKMYIGSSTYVLNWYCNHNNINQALFHARNCLKTLENNPSFNRFHGFYNIISNVYNLAQKSDSALYIKKKGELAKIDLDRANTQAELAEIVTNFQQSVHDNEIKKHKEQLINQSFELKKMYIVTTLLILLSILLFYFFLRTNKLLKKNIIHQKEIKRINKDLKHSLENELFLTKELHHRVKNNLQIIIGLLDLQDKDTIQVNAINKQIFSIAAGHELLYQDGVDGSISLKIYLEELTNYILHAGAKSKPTKVQISSEDIHLDLETIIPIGLMINELISNSLKYAKPSETSLNIAIKIEERNSSIELTYKDNGIGFEIVDYKFGTLVIKAMIQQLRGEMKLDTKSGAHYKFSFPIV